MLFGNLGDYQSNTVRRLDSDLAQNPAGVLADPLGIDLARFSRSSQLAKNDALELLKLILGEHHSAVAPERAQQFVRLRAHHESLFLVGADYVVVERRAADDLPRCTFDVGRFVHQHGRISRAGGDRLLIGLKRLLDHRRSAGHQEQPYTRVIHQFLGRLDRRFRNGAHQIRRTLRFENGAVDPANVLGRNALGSWVDVEDNRIAGRKRGNRVVDDRRGRIRDRGDRADNAPGSELGHRHPPISGHHLRRQVLGSRGLAGDQEIFLLLVVRPAESGLPMRHAGELSGVTLHRPPNRGDQAKTTVEPDGLILLIGGFRGGNRGVDRVEDAQRLAFATRTPVRSASRRGRWG